jgi:hypothetical protein
LCWIAEFGTKYTGVGTALFYVASTTFILPSFITREMYNPYNKLKIKKYPDFFSKWKNRDLKININRLS